LGPVKIGTGKILFTIYMIDACLGTGQIKVSQGPNLLPMHSPTLPQHFLLGRGGCALATNLEHAVNSAFYSVQTNFLCKCACSLFGYYKRVVGVGFGGIVFFRKIKSFLRIGDFCRDLVTGIILPGELFWFEQSVKTNDGLLQLKYLILVT